MFKAKQSIILSILFIFIHVCICSFWLYLYWCLKKSRRMNHWMLTTIMQLHKLNQWKKIWGPSVIEVSWESWHGRIHPMSDSNYHKRKVTLFNSCLGFARKFVKLLLLHFIRIANFLISRDMRNCLRDITRISMRFWYSTKST